MTLEKIIERIKHIRDLLNRHENLLKEVEYNNSAALDCRGNWRVKIEPKVAFGIIKGQMEELNVELGRLEEAKKAGEITIGGWLNASYGVKDEQKRT